MFSLTPPTDAPKDTLHRLHACGRAVLTRQALCDTIHASPAALDALQLFWDDLPPDDWLRDGGRYRRRRHGCFVVHDGDVHAAPPRAHWQPLDYNALHGGLHRWFAPLDPSMAEREVFTRLLAGLAEVASALHGARTWFVEAHPFRIDTTGGIGRPTPEGAHRDGVDMVVVSLVARVGVKGGETRVFDIDGPHGIRFTLTEPWTTLLLDDARVIHETTPIQPSVPGSTGHRDTLVLTFRRDGFLEPRER